MKHNVVPYMVSKGVGHTVVPNSELQYDGIFISNGPGDPIMASKTIEGIRWAIKQETILDIFLGKQILALAAGATMYKMKNGNRGMNQPCIAMHTQNHGYVVDSNSLPEDWKTFFERQVQRSSTQRLVVVPGTTFPFGIFLEKVNFVSVRAEAVLEIIKKEKLEGILASSGGQTALSVGLELYQNGDLERHNVCVMGTQIDPIIDTENCEKFSAKLIEIGETIALSQPTTTCAAGRRLSTRWCVAKDNCITVRR
ncbi:hypothetical protein V7S43_004784 [Phytophthora oleae]|uniref:Tryptophan synthase beta chain-like PALP domain-containing protein n=1 Tax=Phytophthora oleae TaxID=2107226 RepID=A0ABD3FXI8_9STRA